MRFDTVAMSVARGLGCAVGWPVSGSVAPGHLPLPPACASAIACLMFGSFGSWSSETSEAAHSPNRDADAAITAGWEGGRSEEHTSELQSRLHVVCRLLIVKNRPSIAAIHGS